MLLPKHWTGTGRKKHQYVIRSCSLKSVFSNRSRIERRKDHQDIPAYLFLQILLFLSFSYFSAFSLSPRFVCFTHSLVGDRGVTGLALSAADGRWYPFTHTHTHSLSPRTPSLAHMNTQSVSVCIAWTLTRCVCLSFTYINVFKVSESMSWSAVLILAPINRSVILQNKMMH